jgi:hypothetical protein
MPRVPVYQPQVQEQALGMSESRSIVSPELLGVGARQQQALGQALGNASDAGFAIAARQKERDDADAVFKSETQARADWIQAESAFRKSRRADQAKGVTGDTDKWWEDYSGKLMGGVTDPRQRRLLGQSVQKMRTQALAGMQHFEDQQGEVAHDANWQSSKDLLISQAAANPALVPDAVKQLQQKNSYYAAFKGHTDPSVKDAIDLADTTKLHTEVIKQLLTKDPTAAQKYFDEHKDQINGTSYDTLTKSLNTAVAANDGEKAADKVWAAQGPKSYNDAVTLDKMEEAIRQQFPDDHERRKSAIAALRERAAAHNASQAEVKADAINKVMDVYGTTKSLAAVKQSPEWQTLGGADRARIEEHVTNVQTAALNRENARLNRDNLLEQRQQQQLQRRGMAAYLQYSDPQTLSSMSDAQVQALLPSLGNELTSHLVEKKRTLSNHLATTEAKIDNDDFNAFASQIGLKPYEPKKSEEHAATLGALRFRVEQVIDAAQQQKKAPLSRQEKQQLMQTEISRTVTSPTWFGLGSEEKAVIALTPEELAGIKVPAPDRKQITEAMAAAYKTSPRPDLEPTETNIRRWYARGKSPAAALIPNAR